MYASHALGIDTFQSVTDVTVNKSSLEKVYTLEPCITFRKITMMISQQETTIEEIAFDNVVGMAKNIYSRYEAQRTKAETSHGLFAKPNSTSTVDWNLY